MTLPSGLHQKPVNKVFDHGEIRFSQRKNTILFKIIYIEKKTRYPVIKGIVKTREQLDYLLTIKEFPIRINKDMDIVPL